MTATTERLPIHPSLRFHDGCTFDDFKQGERFYSKVFAFEKKNAALVDAMNDRLLKLLRGPLNVFLAEREKVRRDWQIDTGAQAQAFVGLLWEIFEVRRGLTAAHRRHEKAMRQAFEDARQAEMDSLKEIGVFNSMRSFGTNPKAAEIQLAHKAEEHPVVGSAKGDWMDAQRSLRILETLQTAIPLRRNCQLEWPGFAPEVAEVAALIGLELLTHQAEPALSEFAGRIARDMGLAEAPLLPVHVAALEGLAKLGKQTFHPLMEMDVKHLDEARGLIAQLPPTPQVVQFLANSTNGRNSFAAVNL